MWADALGGFDGSDLKAALDACMDAHKDFPPTLPQFVDLCRSARRRRVQEVTALPRPKHRDMPGDVAERIRELSADERHDPKRWAKELVGEWQDGRRGHPLISYQYAHRALGMEWA